ncbi:MAG: BamA/TamA family outer membrane protein [Saprospiraceae bacterium]|nr:BamA/TamA family outer membrane protein [Saprospiraceae bacterium]
MFKTINAVLFFISFSFLLNAQQDSVLIAHVFIIGNKQTCDDVVLRELTVKPGQKIAYMNLPQHIEDSEVNLINTKLFNSAKINFKEENGIGEWVVRLDEVWYIYPTFIFELADRNFNVWWREKEHALDRVNMGVRLDHINLTGHRDKFKLKVQFGYTHKYEFNYDFPFLNEKGTWGLNLSYMYSSNKEVGYETEDNKLEFYKEDDFIYHRRRFTTVAYYRPRFRKTHSFKGEFYNNDVAESVVESYNPDFFNGQRTRIKYFVLEYTFTNNQLDHFSYPMRGYYLEAKLRKEGLGIFNDVNMLSLSTDLEYYYKLNERWGLGHELKGRLQLNRDNPGYYHYTALGYSDNQLRGYELYVIDGLDYILGKHRINYRIMDRSWTFGDWMFVEQFKNPRLRMYATFALEHGYVYSPFFNEGNDLGNRWLIGGGPSLDMLMYNHFLLQVQYSFNGLGENNLFLHFNISF